MVVAGIGIPIMVAANADLGSRIESPMAAVFILCLIATAASLISLMFFPRPVLAQMQSVPPIQFLAGFVFVFYIGSITITVPLIGTGTAVFCVLLGQLWSAAIIDHHGLIGANISPLSLRRLAGLLLMSAGLYFTVSPNALPLS